MKCHQSFFKLAPGAVAAILFMPKICPGTTPPKPADFIEICTHPANEDIRNTVVAMMIKVKVYESLEQKYCSYALTALQQNPTLNLYPDPYDHPRDLVHDLSPLRSFTHFTGLGLGGNRIDDLSPLMDLPLLKELNLTKNQIQDLSPISQLKNLRELIASDNLISDLTPVMELKNLSSLSLSMNQLQNIDAVASLRSLESLYLDDNQIEDVSAIKNLTNLRYLQLGHNHIRDLFHSLQASANTLVLVDLERNPVSAIADLEALTHLDALNLRGTQIADISGIERANNLRWLDLRDTPIQNIMMLKDQRDLQFLYIKGSKIAEVPAEVLILQRDHLNSRGKLIRLKIDGI